MVGYNETTAAGVKRLSGSDVGVTQHLTVSAVGALLSERP